MTFQRSVVQERLKKLRETLGRLEQLQSVPLARSGRRRMLWATDDTDPEPSCARYGGSTTQIG